MSAAFDDRRHGSAPSRHAGTGAALQVAYEYDRTAAELLADSSTLAVLSFGAAHAADAAPLNTADPRLLRVALPVLGNTAPLEVWRVAGPVRHGRSGALHHADDGHLQFVSLELPDHGDVRSTAREAYALLRAFVAGGDFPHVLRIWNYCDAITAGQGDEERYRQFCIGRAEGMGPDWGPYPAATAIGRPPDAGTGTLQVYALASRSPGTPLENSRQVSAYRYPRDYGPQPPSFARAMLAHQAAVPLLLSGTASVVGHASAHAGNSSAQLVETCANLEHLLAAARELDATLPAAFGNASILKAYLHDPADADAVATALSQRFPGAALLLLHARVCRRELLVEIDGFHGRHRWTTHM